MARRDRVPNVSQNTPLMVGGLLYVSTAVGVATALDPATGKVVWFDVPPDGQATRPRRRSTGSERAAASRIGPTAATPESSRSQASIWSRSTRRPGNGIRISAGTGTGDVDLSKGYDRPRAGYRWGGPPLVVGDVIVLGGLGGQPGENSGRQNGNQGDIRGYDVRTGKLLWKFRTVPRPGEFGNETWLNDSWSYSGDVSVWGQLSGRRRARIRLRADRDAEQQLLRRRAAGEQPVRGEPHLPRREDRQAGVAFPGGSPRASGTGTSIRRQRCSTSRWTAARIKAVAEVSKQNFVYVFDRVTGQPVWPIEERPVPRGNVPGEWYSPTQPFPTKPPPFDQQGVTIDDLVDFTPELKQEALAIVNAVPLWAAVHPAHASRATGRQEGIPPDARDGIDDLELAGFRS